MDVSEVRRRLRAAIESARSEAAARRVRDDKAGRDYEAFLTDRATPVFHQVASALTGDGHPFKVFTPAGGVRLASDRSPEEFVELSLDTTTDEPQVLLRSSRGRGRRLFTSERPVGDRTPIDQLTSEQLLELLLEEIPRMLLR